MELTNPFDIQRLKEFSNDVDALKAFGYLRFFTAEISKKLGESKGNVSSYYNGKKPISDSFITAFRKAYAEELKKVRQFESSFSEDGSANYVKDIEHFYGDYQELYRQVNNRLIEVEKTFNKLVEIQEKLELIVEQISIKTKPIKVRSSRKKTVKSKKLQTKTSKKKK